MASHTGLQTFAIVSSEQAKRTQIHLRVALNIFDDIYITNLGGKPCSLEHLTSRNDFVKRVAAQLTERFCFYSGIPADIETKTYYEMDNARSYHISVQTSVKTPKKEYYKPLNGIT